MRKYPRCDVCGKITEIIGKLSTNEKIFGCKTPENCGWKEYFEEYEKINIY